MDVSRTRRSQASPLRLPAAILLILLITCVVEPSVDAHASDAGMTTELDLPDPITGATIDVLTQGATLNNSSNDDATAINKAINAAQPGDVVYLPAGTYHVKSTITLKSGVSLGGLSRDTTTIASMLRSSTHAILYAPPGVNNLTVANITITKHSGSEFSAGLRLGNLTGDQVTRILARDLRIEKFQRFGVQLQNAYHVGVYRNTIRDATSLGGNGSGYGIIIDQDRSNENWIRENSIGPTIRHGILLQYSAHHNLIEGNTITGAVSSGIDLHGEDEYSNEIRYNTVTDCVRNGTSVSPNGGGIEIGEFSGIAGSTTRHDNSGPNNWVHHNQVRNCSYGLRIVNNSNQTLIEDNQFEMNDISGIAADLAPLRDLQIKRNTLRENANGIMLSDVADATLSGNVIYNNDYGVVLNNVTGSVVLSNNQISANRLVGFWSNVPLSSYTVSGNTVTNNGVNLLVVN